MHNPVIPASLEAEAWGYRSVSEWGDLGFNSQYGVVGRKNMCNKINKHRPRNKELRGAAKVQMLRMNPLCN